MYKINLLLISFSIVFLVACKPENSQYRKLSIDEYRQKVYASWIGQIIGNTYGLSYEFKYIDNPGPAKFPYNYGSNILKLKEVNGAFSDDDTDIEYLYLTQMEKYGIEPSYKNLTEAWKYHIRDKVWCANRVALTLMHAGYYPPYTGKKEYNTQWCQIDPQLVNEIWAVTSPGMLNYAVQKSDYAARITSDSFGVEPTLFYAALYSEAFFEKDIKRLLNKGLAYLPNQSRFAKIVNEMIELQERYPNDWQKSRKEMASHYYKTADYNKYCWPVVDANLNGACAVLALLYGNGSFHKTLDLCCGIGFDADNQSATVCGLLGIMYGMDSIPQDLLYPVKELNWKKPFNDFYKNISRYDMPDASISDQSNRISNQGVNIVLAKGGKMITENGKKYLLINSLAIFTAPFELNSMPPISLEQGSSIYLKLYAGGVANKLNWALIAGVLPIGIHFENGLFSGKSAQVGEYPLTIKVLYNKQTIAQTYRIIIRKENLARKAQTILYNNKNCISENINVIKDGNSKGETFYCISKDSFPKNDYYGYEWNTKQKISSIIYNVGNPNEFAGWFTSLDVEYKDETGNWQKIISKQIAPTPNLDNNQWLKPSFIDYTISFEPVQTKAIRIIGKAGGIAKDEMNKKLGMQYYTAISELSVY